MKKYFILSINHKKSIALLLVSQKSALPWQPTAYPQSGKRQHAVEHKEFVAELVAPYALGYRIDGEAEQGRGYGYVGHKTIGYGATCDKSEGEETEQRTVGVRAHYVDGIYHTGGIEHSEQQDERHKHYGNAYVCTSAQTLVGRSLAYVNTIACGECRKSGVGT